MNSPPLIPTVDNESDTRPLDASVSYLENASAMSL
jgi:hypothetical protein